MIRYVSTERGRRLPCRRVATHAVRGVQRVIVVDVARRARSWRRRHVRPRQRKTCNAVVERSPVPSLRRVAVRTVRQRKCWTSRRVHRIVRLLPGREVAPGCPARSGCDVQAVVVVDVAARARNVRVTVREWKTKSGVIKFSVGPCCDRVARRAGRGRRRETSLDVIRNISSDGRSAIPIGLVAAHAIGRVERVIVVDVARRARSRRRRHVRPGQRKSCNAVIERSRVPTFRRVAVRAVRQRKSRA